MYARHYIWETWGRDEFLHARRYSVEQVRRYMLNLNVWETMGEAFSVSKTRHPLQDSTCTLSRFILPSPSPLATRQRGQC